MENVIWCNDKIHKYQRIVCFYQFIINIAKKPNMLAIFPEYQINWGRLFHNPSQKRFQDLMLLMQINYSSQINLPGRLKSIDLGIIYFWCLGWVVLVKFKYCLQVMMIFILTENIIHALWIWCCRNSKMPDSVLDTA